MKISIIGAGHIGGTLARLFVKAGYQVMIANSRGPASLFDLSEELGAQLQPLTVEEAVKVSDIIVVSIHWRSIDFLPVFKVPGKIIVDTTNPYREDGTFYDLGDGISSAKVIDHFPGGTIVKAFNTIWFKHLGETGNIKLPVAERRVIPVAGDDKNAKSKISKIIEDIGFGPLDTGSLTEGSRLQGVQGILYNKEITVNEAASLIRKLK